LIPFGGNVKLVHAEKATHEAMTDDFAPILDSLDAYLFQFQMWLESDPTRKRVKEAKAVLVLFQALQSHAKLLDRLLLEDWVRKDTLYKAMRRAERTIEGLGIVL